MVEREKAISLLPRCRVEEIEADQEQCAVKAVRYSGADGVVSTIPCDLVVDASGRGALTLALLDRLGLGKPEETEIGIDMAYCSAIFEVPPDAPTGWKGIAHLPLPSESSRGAFLFPIENGRWIVGLGERHGEPLPTSLDGFTAFLGGLRTKRIYDAVKNAKQIGEFARFGVPSSVRRRFETLSRFPRGLIPLGDAICRFNPVYGQGMTVAAQEARLLRELLAQRQALADPLAGLAEAFFQGVQPLLATPWSVAENDFAYPQTRGQRPADIDGRLRFGAALLRLAAEDASVHKTMMEVNMLLKPMSALREPQIAGRVVVLMNAPS